MGLAVGDRRVTNTRVRSLVVVATLGALLFTVLYVFSVRTAWGQRLDATSLAGSALAQHPRVERATEALLTTVSIGSVALVGAAIVLVALARGRPHLAVAAVIVLLASDVTAEILKRKLLIRPDLIGPDGRGLVQSFPSGHTTVAASLALAAVLVAPRRARGAVAVIGGAYAIGIGEAVVTTGWHRPSDALGSFLLVTAWVAVAAGWVVSRHGRLVERGAARRPPIVSPTIAVVGVVALGVGFAGLIAVAVALRANRLDLVDLDTAYAAASAAIAGVGLLVMATVVFLLRGFALDPPPAPIRGAITRGGTVSP